MHGMEEAEEIFAVANAVGAAVTTCPGALTALSNAEAIRTHCGSLP